MKPLKMDLLDSGFSVEVDLIGKEEWTDMLGNFDDAVFYQTWSRGAVHWGEGNLSHVVLRKERDIMAAAQARVIKFPLLDAGIAYVFWGPMWHRKGKEADPENFRHIIRALYYTYVKKKKLLLRIVPKEFNAGGETVRGILTTEGYHLRQDVAPYRTLLVDLSMSLDQLRKGLKRKWRQELGYAEKTDLELNEGTSVELLNEALKVYKEMHARKGFVEYVDMEELRAIQEDLPEGLRMRIIIIKSGGEPVGALAFATIGNTALPLLAATGDKGLKLGSSYLMWWKMIEWLKMHGFQWCDLGGINPERTPGTYIFRAGIAGKNGKDLSFLGQFDAYENSISSLFVKGGDKFRKVSLDIKAQMNKLVNKHKLNHLQKSRIEEEGTTQEKTF
jgi:hypothetical protein